MNQTLNRPLIGLVRALFMLENSNGTTAFFIFSSATT